jgi:6-phosphogluconolactonase/glucosamine-6-phosphate isomerase/deaminase
MTGYVWPEKGRKIRDDQFVLIQEEAGVHVGISPSLPDTARHAAHVMFQRYEEWLSGGRLNAWGQYKRNHFTIAVGGGNTLKSQYKAWLDHYHSSIDWVAHARFFFLEESTGETGWESAENSLVMNFIVPLAQKLCKMRGLAKMAKQLKLEGKPDQDDIIDAMTTRMVHGINLGPARRALDDGNSRRAMKLAREECERYQQDIEHKVGGTLALHCIVSGIGKDGTIGAFAPYTPELSIREPGAVILKQESGALRIALNRGVLTNAEHVSLLVSGNLKLKALGRFEMDESADFEQTVMETPLRLLRESYETAEKVYIFADEQALHFDETVFEYREKGEDIQNKAETREGEEIHGIHILLMHGFMGLFSFANLLIRLPSAWTVSALHRGSRAKFLPKEEVFPHYARVLRKAILKNWRRGRPVPVAGHSIAGLIMDHLLISVLDDPDADIPPYEQLSRENQDLVNALRASGIIYLASWAPLDGPNTGENVKSLVSHLKERTELDYGGFEQHYRYNKAGKLEPIHQEALADAASSMAGLNRFLDRQLARPLVNSMNLGLRSFLNNRTVQQRMLNADMPYVLRIVGGRLLKTASLYGLAREINAGQYFPVEYQQHHLKALDILLEYDIPLLSIIHKDDFLVSARRHWEEHQYLLKERMKKEGVKREQDLDIPARYIAIERESEELPVDPLNPHLLVMATSNEGNTMARQITAAMTQFVYENVARAVRKKTVRPLDSVKRWQRKQKPASRRKGKVA